jgi:hypothetical protein
MKKILGYLILACLAVSLFGGIIADLGWASIIVFGFAAALVVGLTLIDSD